MLVRLAAVLARKAATLLELWHTRGLRAVFERTKLRLGPDSPSPPAEHPSAWLKNYRPSSQLLERFRSTIWPTDAPTLSVLMPVFNTREDWLRQAVVSVQMQTYSNWQLVCVNDASTAPHVQPLLDEFAAADPRIRVIHLDANRGVAAATNAALAVATGEYVGFLDHDDALEPHALHRLAEAVRSENRPGLLYSDEALTGPDLDNVLAIRARPAFSHDYYLCHPYFVHLVAMRTELVRRIGGLNETMTTSHDVDLVLRMIEVAERVTHIPDVLYRWRTHADSLGHQQKQAATEATRGAVSAHVTRFFEPPPTWLGRSASRTDHLHTREGDPDHREGGREPRARPDEGLSAHVLSHPTQYNVFDVRFPIDPAAKVAILIPTKNQAGFLHGCIESLERTTPRILADIVVIDHASDDLAALAYLKELQQRHRVVSVSGPFNFSTIMNSGVRQVRGPYTHYLFLNNDTVAPEPGWLEHMLGFGCRADVGCVGATLIYPDDTVQHAGVIVGLLDGADHAFRSWRFGRNHYEREPGDNCGLVCNRDYSAVTAACLLMRADVFEQVNGFDERLAVGFNDTDLCLRVRAAGYRVIQDSHAVLFHYESQSRGTVDRHPADTAQFRERYAELFRIGDPYFNPLLENSPLMNVLKPTLRCPERMAPRTSGVGRLGVPPTG